MRNVRGFLVELEGSEVGREFSVGENCVRQHTSDIEQREIIRRDLRVVSLLAFTQNEE